MWFQPESLERVGVLIYLFFFVVVIVNNERAQLDIMW